ncbi:MAG: hypothetical protein AAGG02_01485 [Cyanobacteria bacterium P01_H01_bin.15]
MSLCLVALCVISGCGNPPPLDPPSPYALVQEESSQQSVQAVDQSAINGAQFNRFFPTTDGDYSRVYTQEKQGFAEAKLKQEDMDIAMLSISDTLSNPAARDKFTASKKTIAGFPAVNQGSTGTAILVRDRYQVKVLSRSETFTSENRESWLIKFDLDGLAKLQ